MPKTPEHLAIPPLRVDEGSLSPAAAAAEVQPPDPLYLSPEMKDYVDRYIRTSEDPRATLRALNAAIQSSSMLNVQYEAVATGTAEQVFRSGEANCLGFSNLFIALARYADLDAHFQQVVVKPTWDQRGDVLTVNMHINVTGKTSRRATYNADIDWRNYRRASAKYKISDAEGLQQYYNNLAMEALEEDAIRLSYSYLVLAMQVGPVHDYLWTNLGYLFRRNEQYSEAAASYDRALLINPDSTTAMQNYLALLDRTGDRQKAEAFEKKLLTYRRQNPYYYAQFSRLAAADSNWSLALKEIDRAIKLKSEEFEFHLARLGYLAADERWDEVQETLPQLREMASNPQRKAQLDALIARLNIEPPAVE